MRALLLINSVLIFGISNFAQAKNLYVNNSGSPACSDATTYAVNDNAHPWCTIGRASWGSTNPNAPLSTQAAQAGDTVLISAGTYTTISARTSCSQPGMSWNVALNPANSGTVSSPIIFRGQGVVNLRLGSGYAGATIGVDSRHYIVWDNVRLDETVSVGQSCADHGPVVVHVCAGCKILNSTIRGLQHDWGDNYCGIRVEAVKDAVFFNNAISDIKQAGGHNAAGFMMYDTSNSIFEHNRVTNSNTGFYIKGNHNIPEYPQRDNTFRFNWVENCSAKGFFTVAGNGSRIYQNIVKNCSIGMRIDVWPAPYSTNISIFNNTFIATSGGYGDTGWAYSAGNGNPEYLSNVRFFNNIVSGPWESAVENYYLSQPGDQTFEHNIYYNVDSFGSLNGAAISLATWKNTHGKDSASPPSIGSDPLFSDTTLYKLQTSSPARNLGVDVLDLNGNGSTTDIIPAGAYITGNEMIGVNTAGSPPSALSRPVNVRVLRVRTN